MRFAYTAVPVRAPVHSAGGALTRLRPIVSVVIGPTGTQRILDCLIDSGADDTILPLRIAVALGIDLTHAPTGSAQGLGGMALSYRYAPVQLRLTDGSETCVWTAIAGFVDLPMPRGYLVQSGFFEVTFRSAPRAIEVVPGPSFSGTVSRP
jgi:hypothetical protein